MADDQRQNPPLLFPAMQPALPPLPQTRDQSERKKIKIQWMERDYRRRATLKKRRDNIIKKAEELNILCGVQVNAVIFSPGEDEPVVYPNVDETEAMCRRFMQLPEMDRTNFMRTHQQFLEETLEKKRKKVWKKQEQIEGKKTTALVRGALAGNDIRGVDLEKLREMKSLMETMYTELYPKSSLAAQATAAAAARAPPPPEQQMMNRPGFIDEDSAFCGSTRSIRLR